MTLAEYGLRSLVDRHLFNSMPMGRIDITKQRWLNLLRRDEFHRYFDRVGRVERRLIDPHNPLEFLTAEEIFVRFRFRPLTIFYIVDLLEDSLRRPAGNTRVM